MAARGPAKRSAKRGAKAKAAPRKNAAKESPNTRPKKSPPRRVSTATPSRSSFSIDGALALKSLRTADPILGRSIDAIGEFALAREMRAAKSVYEALAEAIVAQQLSGKAAATIYGRVCALFPGNRGGPRPEQVLASSDEALRGAGLSRAKGLALRDLAERTLAGEIPTLAQARRLDDDEVVARLTTVRGIGRWTAEMFLIFRLGRPDVLPVDDYGVRKGFALAFGQRELPHPKALAAHGERWAPYRTVASWYLWRVADRG